MRIRIGIVKRKADGTIKRSHTICPGSFVLIAAPESTRAHDQTLPTAVGMAVETPSRNGKLVVALALPEMGRVKKYKAGARTNADLFGAWAPVDSMSAEALRHCRLPVPIVRVQLVLACAFDLTDCNQLP